MKKYNRSLKSKDDKFLEKFMENSIKNRKTDILTEEEIDEFIKTLSGKSLSIVKEMSIVTTYDLLIGIYMDLVDGRSFNYIENTTEEESKAISIEKWRKVFSNECIEKMKELRTKYRKRRRENNE